jgi:hypothetical protein
MQNTTVRTEWPSAPESLLCILRHDVNVFLGVTPCTAVVQEPTTSIIRVPMMEAHSSTTVVPIEAYTKLLCVSDNLIPEPPKAGDTLSSRHVSSCDITSAVGM